MKDSPQHEPETPVKSGNGALHPLPPGTVDHEDTGLPLFRSWGSIYVFVTCVFVIWVTLMLLFMRAFR